MTDKSQELCFFCEVNGLDHTYACCHKQCCYSCYTKFYNRNITCPWCRQDPSFFTEYNQNILLSFENWLKDHNIKRTPYVNRCIEYVKSIDTCFANKQSDTIEFQVANLNKIHVFKYNNINQLSFKYWDKWGTIEVKGGNYYKYDKPHNSDHFGWWLHGFVKQV